MENKANQQRELSVTTTSNSISTLNMFNELTQVKAFADNVIASKLFKGFETAEQVVMQVLIGNEIGMSPMQALMYGKQLDQTTFAKINKGKTLGFDINTSLEKIYSFERNGKATTGVGVDVINALLAKHMVTYTVDADYQPLYKFFDVADLLRANKEREANPKAAVAIKEYDHYEVNKPDSIYQIMTSSADVLEAGKIGVRRGSVIGYYTQITFTRLYPNGTQQVIPVKLSTLDAQRAEWLGVESNGVITGGNLNWNRMPSIMLRNRVISIGGRLIIPDVLAGMYELTELAEINGLKVEVTEEGTATIIEN